MMGRGVGVRGWLVPAIRATGETRRRWRQGFTLIELILAVAVLATLAAIAIPAYRDAVEKARMARAIGDISTLGKELLAYQVDTGGLPDTLGDVSRANWLDPWGTPYQYLKIACVDVTGKCKAPAGARKDRFLVPLNSDFDLYSMGRDGDTRPPLTARVSRDDVLRAGDGGYIGLASEF